MFRRLGAIAALSLVLAACGGGGDDEPDRTVTPAFPTPRFTEIIERPRPTEPPGMPVDAAQSLLPAADKWAAAETLSGSFLATAALGSQNLTFAGTLHYRAPDTSYIIADYFGRRIEMLGYGPSYYINVPDQGWKAADLDSIGVDLTQLTSVAENRGFFDMHALIAALDNIEQLSDGEIEGVEYARYRAGSRLARIADQLPGLVSPEIVAGANEYVEGLTFEFWIAKDTGLPRRVSFTVETPGTSDEGSGGLEMTIDFEQFNRPVEIPAEPVGAPPLETDDLTG
jgi:hypothetical protein